MVLFIILLFFLTPIVTALLLNINYLKQTLNMTKRVVIIHLALCLIIVVGCSVNHGKFEDVVTEFKMQNNKDKIYAAQFLVDNINEHLSGERTDSCTLNSDFLIMSVNDAFESVEQNRFVGSVKLDNLCEYILPCCNDIWDVEFKKKFFENDLDYLRSLDSWLTVFDVITLLRNRYAEIKYSNDVPYTRSLGEFIDSGVANCRLMSNFNAVMFSTLGFPVVVDCIPAWGNTSNNHVWNSLLYNDNEYPFDSFFISDGWGYEYMYNNSLPDTIYGKKRLPKIYRQTFSKQNSKIIAEVGEKNIPSFFRNDYLKDVSSLYFESTYIAVNVPKRIANKYDYVWIFIFNNETYVPVAWSEIKSGKALFKDMGRDIVYFFGAYVDGKIDKFGEAVYCGYDGKLTPLIASESETETIVMKRKYPHLNINPNIYCSALLGTTIEGKNSDGYVVLKTINSGISSLLDTIRIDNCGESKYQTFRVSIPYNALSSGDRRISEGDFRTVADLDFYVRTTDGIKIIKPSKYNPEHEKLFDDNTLTYISTDSKLTFEIEVSFEKPITIYGVNITPKNDKNYIYEGYVYELRYWENCRWNTLEKKAAKSHQIVFENVPENALLWLRCLTEGKEERIFKYLNEGPIWY